MLEPVIIGGIPCHNCQNHDYIVNEKEKGTVYCPECGDTKPYYCNELWAILENMRDKMEWEGGMDEVLLNYSNHKFFDVGDEKLLNAAKKAEDAFKEFKKEWKRICKENDVSPYF